MRILSSCTCGYLTRRELIAPLLPAPLSGGRGRLPGPACRLPVKWLRIPGVMPDIVPNVSHTVVSQQAAIDGGRMDGYACIGGYTPDQAPNLAALARRFAISDRTFSMADSPSWGGHLYAVMGSLGFSITADNDWLGQVASAVMNGPEWPSTVLFITWDDCGCFYDQVPPGVNPDGTAQGPRTPLVIVSPYAKPSYTDTTATTFAGILACTEHTSGLLRSP